MNKITQVDNAGAAFTAECEAFVPHPYQDTNGTWTIGYGTTLYPNGKKVTANDAPITKEVGRGYMMTWLNTFIAPRVDALTADTINQNQFNAICDFCYNAGVGAYTTSTLRKLINSGNFGEDIIKDAFLMFNKEHKNGKLVVNQGIVNRRLKEIELFFKK